jgi:hypothetical protein
MKHVSRILAKPTNAAENTNEGALMNLTGTAYILLQHSDRRNTFIPSLPSTQVFVM